MSASIINPAQATQQPTAPRRPLDLLRVWHTKIEACILEQADIEHAHQEDAAPALRMVGESEFL
ncbi:MAG TPA: hypothetical protein PKW99_03565 [Thauera sp.]|nr:hypothetical protein [Thauera sp.]